MWSIIGRVCALLLFAGFTVFFGGALIILTIKPAVWYEWISALGLTIISVALTIQMGQDIRQMARKMQ